MDEDNSDNEEDDSMNMFNKNDDSDGDVNDEKSNGGNKIIALREIKLADCEIWFVRFDVDPVFQVNELEQSERAKRTSKARRTIYVCRFAPLNEQVILVKLMLSPPFSHFALRILSWHYRHLSVQHLSIGNNNGTIKVWDLANDNGQQMVGIPCFRAQHKLCKSATRMTKFAPQGDCIVGVCDNGGCISYDFPPLKKDNGAVNWDLSLASVGNDDRK